MNEDAIEEKYYLSALPLFLLQSSERPQNEYFCYAKVAGCYCVLVRENPMDVAMAEFCKNKNS